MTATQLLNAAATCSVKAEYGYAWISEVYDEMTARGYTGNLDAFKQEILAMHRNREIRLRGMDLTADKDAGLLTTSATNTESTTYYRVCPPKPMAVESDDDRIRNWYAGWIG